MSGGSKEPYRIDHVKVVRESGAALLVLIDGQQVWIPKSQVLDESEVWGDGDQGQLVIPEWLAIERGL